MRRFAGRVRKNIDLIRFQSLSDAIWVGITTMDDTEPEDPEPKDQSVTPVPYEPGEPPVIERPEERVEQRPERPIGYARTQPAVVEGAAPNFILSG
jgi:hypothetical protein